MEYLEDRTLDNFKAMQNAARPIDRWKGGKWKLIEASQEVYDLWKNGI
jgi:hypothetical protein